MNSEAKYVAELQEKSKRLRSQILEFYDMLRDYGRTLEHSSEEEKAIELCRQCLDQAQEDYRCTLEKIKTLRS